ncbi:MAG: hypothetical protein VX768_12850 [Planctomycetota bacterium]|nr:hypothetical protein [Planctomycetota bacterium]
MRSNPRTAFTLLEVLISLALVTTLMALGWSLLYTFARLEGRSRKTVASLEITRSLRRQMQNDLDQLVNFTSREERGSSPVFPSESLPEGNDTESIFAADSAGNRSTTNSDLSAFGNGIGGFSTDSTAMLEGEELTRPVLFEGTADSLTFLVRTDGSQFLPSSREEYLVISYRWQDRPDQENVLESSGQEEDELEGEPGFEIPERREFVRSVMTLADYQRSQRFGVLDGSPEDRARRQLRDFETVEVGRAENTDVMGAGGIREQLDRIPEIREIGFRYFDGNEWSSLWVAGQDPIPLAIEVLFRAEAVDPSGDEQGFMEKGDEGESELDSLDFEEMVIGDPGESVFERETDDLRGREPEIPRDFDPETRRFLIRTGTRRPVEEIADEERESGSFSAERGGP